jgi:hypothetical protein
MFDEENQASYNNHYHNGHEYDAANCPDNSVCACGARFFS